MKEPFMKEPFMKEPFKTTAMLMTLLGSAACWAASDGSVGSDSEGELDISFTIDALVVIEGLRDVAYGSSFGSMPEHASEQNFCVGQNYDGNIEITFTSSNSSSGRFQLQDKTNPHNRVQYEVLWKDKVNASIAESITAQSGVSIAVNGAYHELTCTVNNFSMWVTIDSEEILAASSADYEDAIIITVAAQ